MARTIKQIYDEAASEKNSLSSLDVYLVNPQDNSSTLDTSQGLLESLTTPSKVATWRLILWVIAFMIWVHEKLWDNFKADVDLKIASAKPGTKLWYQQQAFIWQYGDPLVWDGSKYIYQNFNASLQLVKRCSINDNGGIVRVKVAKGQTPVPLSVDEEASFTAYMNQIKFAGTNLLVINYEADQVKMAWEIFYNPLYQPAIVRANVEAAIQNYLSNIPFDGVLVKNAFIDAVQQAEGVIDPILLQCQTNNISAPFASFVNQVQAVSGYFIVSPDNPLNGFYDAPTNTIPVIKLTPYV